MTNETFCVQVKPRIGTMMEQGAPTTSLHYIKYWCASIQYWAYCVEVAAQRGDLEHLNSTHKSLQFSMSELEIFIKEKLSVKKSI
ncbi:MAG: hypothetical protein ACRDF4_04165 [Rhabdochlamydiaceae bacterium]